jgi:hypothetical protein
MFGDLKSGPQWIYEVLRTLGVEFHLQSLKFKTPTNFFVLCNKPTKFKCLVI